MPNERKTIVTIAAFLIVAITGAVGVAALFRGEPAPEFIIPESERLNETAIFGENAFAEIPPGAFVRGSTAPCSKGEELPIHDVQITKPVRILRQPVSVDAWKKIMGTDTSNVASKDGMAVGVTWLKAVEFAKRVSAHTGAKYALPTEAEWEFAARKAHENNDAETDPLDFFAIGEWCHDTFIGYSGFEDNGVDPVFGPDPLGAFLGVEAKIVRGLRHEGECPVPYSHRDYYLAETAMDNVGFRLVRLDHETP